jgi:hypothetical protein
MKSTARLFTMASIFCCLIASWAVARAQDSLQGSGDILGIPRDPGISVKGGPTGLLSDPILGPAIGSTSPASGTSLNLPEQFTLSNTQSIVTLSITPGSAISAGENPSANKSCLLARAYIRPDIVNKNLHQNWISAKNNCDRYIKIKVCYHSTASCIPISVPPRQTKSTIIGYAPTANPIHYQISLEN